MLTWLKRNWQDATVAQAPRLGPHANTAWAAAVHGPSALTPVGRRLPPCATGPACLMTRPLADESGEALDIADQSRPSVRSVGGGVACGALSGAPDRHWPLSSQNPITLSDRVRT